MTLTTEQHSRRKIGGSDAAVIMNGEHFGKTPFTLWQEKTGRAEPEDLTWKLNVQLGIITEDLNRRWYEHETGNMVETWAKTFIHTEADYVTAHLDGTWSNENAQGVFEAKHIGAFNKADPAQAYYPQLQHYMAVTGMGLAHIAAIKGTDTWFYSEVEREDAYIAEMMERYAAFWWCVETDQPPKGSEPVPVPELNPEKVVDLTGSNEWAAYAGIWTETLAAKKSHEKAAKDLKAILEPDAARTFGHGIEAIRNKRGVTIKMMKEAAE